MDLFGNKVYLDVPFSEKDMAKALGAKWDPNVRKWYCPEYLSWDTFAKWIPDDGPGDVLVPTPYRVPVTVMLSDEQEEMVKRVQAGRNVLVEACIGSGKTTAIQALCSRMAGRTILYLTYNRLLKEDAKKKIIQTPSMTVTNYHGFAFKLLQNIGVHVNQSELVQVFNREKPPMDKPYDLLIMDEYQDIDAEISEMLKYVKESCPGIQIVAVGDMDQKIYDKTTLNAARFISGFLDDYDLLRFTKCFRLNPEYASELAAIWNKKITGVNSGCQVSEMSIPQAIGFIAGQDLRDVLCLGPREGDMSYVLNELERKWPEKFNKHTVYASIRDEDRSALKSTADAAIFTTYDSSKGLERSVCLIFGWTKSYWEARTEKPMADYTVLRNMFLVAASRGKDSIVFVRGRTGQPLKFSTVGTPTAQNRRFDKPFHISTMFDFQHKELVERAFRCLNLEKVHDADLPDLEIRSKDGYIDLSPCIGNYQEAVFFEKYDIDKAVQTAIVSNPDNAVIPLPRDPDFFQKLLIIAALDTGYERYLTQVSVPFVTDAQKEELCRRLATRFTGREAVQEGCGIRFTLSDRTECSMTGVADVTLPGNKLVELKYVSELAHEHFLQLACYMTALQSPEGFLWNVRTGEQWKVTIPGRRQFIENVVLCITKGGSTLGYLPKLYETPLDGNLSVSCSGARRSGSRRRTVS